MSEPTPSPFAEDTLPGLRAAVPAAGLERISQVAGIGYWSVNRKTRRARWSPEMRALHGLTDRDPVPRASDWLARHVHLDDRARTLEVMQRVRRDPTQAVQFGVRVMRPDGTVRDLLTHSISEVDGEVDQAYGVVVDVSPLRRAEQDLQRAEGRVALTASALGLGTWEVEYASGHVRWDEPMWLLRGQAPRAQAPTYDERMALVHPDDRAQVRDLNAGYVTAHYEFRVIWPDGRVRWLASRSTTLHDEAGQPLRRIGVNWDITSSRQAAAELHEREVALRDSRTRQQTLARMSHDLRTPLNAILGCTQLLQVAGSPDPALLQQRLAQIDEAGRHLLALVDRVLDLAGPVADGAPQPALPAQDEPSTQRRTVLYIEDNNVNAMIVCELVRRRGDLEVVVADTGREGLRLAAELQPPLVLLDMQLPDMDGSEVFARLKADPRTAALPCVALSANVMQADIDAALASGMTAYWTKPLDFKVFSRQLDALLGPAPGSPAR